MTKSDNEWRWVTASESSGTANENGIVHLDDWMNDCHHFNDKKRCTTISRDGWLQLEWLNNRLCLRFYKKVFNK